MRRAFTLIELLVVIAILALLAALLFPVFAAVRERGRTAYCSNNLKQIGTGLLLYVDDWDGYLPIMNGNLPDFVNPYLQKKGEGVWLCPSDPFLELPEQTQRLGLQKDRYSSYWQNGQFIGYSTTGSDPCTNDPLMLALPRSLSTVSRPASTIMVIEGMDGDLPGAVEARARLDLFHGQWSEPVELLWFTGLRHQKKSNC
jgi:prepilin-type N-terminal cleavage/methylation domain-containing protein